MNRQIVLIFWVWLAASPAVADHIASSWNGGSGNWSTAANWSPNTFFPNNGNGGNTYDAGIGGGGTVTLDQDITVRDFYLSSNVVYSLYSTLTATLPYTLTVNGAMTWNYTSTMSGPGQTVIAPTGSLSMIGNFHDSTHQLNRQLVNNGTTNWTGLNQLNMNGSTFINNGNFTANVDASGQLMAAVSGTGGTNAFNNYGTFTKIGSGTTVFAVSTSDVPFNNYGAVDIQSGLLWLENQNSVSSHTGDFSIAGGASLRIRGTHNFAAGSELTGGGTLYLRGATATFNGPQNFGGRVYFESSDTAIFNNNSTINGLTLASTSSLGLTGTGSVTLTGASDWTFGTMSGTGQTVIAPGASLTLLGQRPYEYSGNAQLKRHLVNNGEITWYGGGLAFGWEDGTLTNNGTFTADSAGYGQTASTNGFTTNTFNNVGTFTKLGAGQTYFNFTANSYDIAFNNTGTVDVQTGTLNLGRVTQHNGSQLTGGSWRVRDNATLEFGSAANITTNFADVTLDGPGSTFAKINSLLNNQGRFSILNGRDFTAGGVFSNPGELVVGSSSTFNAPSLAQLTGGELTGGTWHITGTLATGGDNITINRGSLTLNGPTSTFAQSNTISDNRGTLAILNGRNYSYSAGPFSNTGLIVINAGSTVHLSSVSQIDGGELTEGAWYIGQNATLQIDTGTDITTNHAIVTLAGASSSFNKLNSLVNNYGTLEIFAGRDFTAQAAFHNYGTLTVGAGSTFVASNGFTQHSGATLKGSGTLQANFTNSGRLAPGNSPGIVTITGNYTQTASGVLEIEVGGKTLSPVVLHDQVNVSGIATLGGRLETPLVQVSGQPTYSPQDGDEIVILTAAGGVNGTFSSAFLPALPAGVAHEIQYNTNDVRLKFVAPEPIQFVSSDAVAQLTDSADWKVNDNPAVPVGKSVANVGNNRPVPLPQRVDVVAANRSVHQLSIGDPTAEIAMRVDAVSLSVAAGAVIEKHGVIELTNSGALVSQSVDIENGGMLAGNGIIKATTLSNSGGTLRPGFSVGHLDVEGDYVQGANGTLVVDVESSGQRDTIDVTGSVELGGTLRIDTSGITTANPGATYEIISAGSLSGQFSNVESRGNPDIYFLARYDYVAGATSLEEHNRGDMNGDDIFDSTDADLFVFGLLNASTGKFFSKCDCGVFPQQGGDFSENGVLDFADIPGFQSQANGMGMAAELLDDAFDRYFQSVPEPSSAVIAIIAGLVATLSINRGRCVVIAGCSG